MVRFQDCKTQPGLPINVIAKQRRTDMYRDWYYRMFKQALVIHIQDHCVSLKKYLNSFGLQEETFGSALPI